jgi:hypothetical protein
VKRELDVIYQANLDIDAGLGIEDEDMAAWLERLDHDATAPLPSPRRTPPGR